jgi:hypothetical protein
MTRTRMVDDAEAEEEPITGIYLRVTAEESIKADLSLPNQRRRGLEICSERGWSPAKVYQEPKHVGGDELPAKRPAHSSDSARSARMRGYMPSNRI